MSAEYYVLRLYRKEDKSADNVLGTLEESASGISWSFKNDDELHQVIDEVTLSSKTKLKND